MTKFEEKVIEVNDSLNRLKQNDDFKKFFDFYTTENRNYVASMISTHTVDSGGMNKLILELQSVSDFEIYVNSFQQIVDQINNKDKEEEKQSSNTTF